MEPATFRPPMRRLGGHLVLGGLAGAAIGLFCGVPLFVGLLFGAVATAISLAARHSRALRVVADERGLRVLAGPARVDAPWGELRLGFGLADRADGVAQRYAIFADARGRSFAFAGGAGGLPCRPVKGADGRPLEVVELREAPLLLAVIVQRAPAWYVLPESLQAPPRAGEAVEVEAGAPAARAGRPRTSRLGVWGVVVKLGSKIAASVGKLGAGALKAVKTANVGWAVASATTYSLLFSWKFALAIMVQLFVHEYGHVHAMRRTGMKVRGMYFVPFLGALAVTEDAFTSRRQQVYVALNGPLWGSRSPRSGSWPRSRSPRRSVSLSSGSWRRWGPWSSPPRRARATGSVRCGSCPSRPASPHRTGSTCAPSSAQGRARRMTAPSCATSSGRRRPPGRHRSVLVSSCAGGSGTRVSRWRWCSWYGLCGTCRGPRRPRGCWSSVHRQVTEGQKRVRF